MSEYDITITRIEPNPHYVPDPNQGRHDGYHQWRDDTRAEHERSHDVRRMLSATLTEAEYDAVKQALMQHWAARQSPPESEK